MGRKYDDALSAPEGLVKHWAAQGARFNRKEKYRGQDIFLGAGGPHHDAKYVAKDPDDPNVKDEWMNDGYYVAVFAIQIRQAFWGLPVYFKLDHDLNLGAHAREEARLNSALEAAKRIIDDGIDLLPTPIFREYAGEILVPRGVH